jgi:hypothetical protein
MQFRPGSARRLTATMTKTIELDRQFVPFSDGPTGLHVEAYLQVMQQLNRGVSWDVLLKSRWNVVLGEAGTGKSTEFRLRPSILRSRGTPAFFMDITRLAKRGPEFAVEQTALADLETWREGEADGVFFLDSVDEAELRHESLGDALRQLDTYMGDARARARIVVSCRVSDWGTASGHQDMSSYIRSIGGDPDELQIVQLMPLDDRRVKDLAQHYGCSDPQRLIDAVREASAQPFVARPLDVEWLVNYWEEHGQVGTLTQLVERSVDKRLDERRPNSSPASRLPKQKARNGLERLAGLAVLSGRWSFLIPGEKHLGAGPDDTIDPRQALEDWSDDEIRELLTRAVFDESTYGRVRLHHRAVQEYLAAKWLRGMVEQGLTRRELERVLVRELGGRRFVPAHLLPTAAWLSLWNAEVRDWLVSAEPEALFQHGDPAGLNVRDRQLALEAYLERYQSQERLFDHFDRGALRRFAPAMEEAVRTNLRRQDLPHEAIAFLLELAVEGDLRSCSSDAVSWAADTTADSRLRCEAFRAAADLAAEHEKRFLADQVLAASGEWGQDVAGVFASRFFPSVLSAGEVGALLRRVAPGRPNLQTRIKTFVWHELPNGCPSAERLTMLGELAETVRQTARDKGWLLHGIQELSRVIIEALGPDEEPPDELQAALVLLRSTGEVPFDGATRFGELLRAIAAKPRVRRWLFWQRLEEAKDEGGKWPEFLPYQRRPLSEVGMDDAEWLAEDSLDHVEPRARVFAFNTLRQLRRGVPSLQAVLDRVAASSADPAFAERLEADERARNAPREVPGWEVRLREAQEKREQERAEEHLEELEVFHSELERIRSGEHRRLLQILCRRTERDDNTLGVDLEQLRDEFDAEIAEAAASGLKACWREARPPFQFEESSRSTVSGDVDIGLAGLQLEFAEGLDPSQLSDSEVELAVRYAARQFNGIPDWFANLAEARRVVVAEALRPAIEADVRLQDPDAHPEILRYWRKLPDTLRLPVARMVLRELEAHAPANGPSLDDTLAICSWLDGEEAKRFADVCLARYEEAGSIEVGVKWWCAMARMDPMGAVCCLEEFADGAQQDDLDAVMEATCAELGGDWDGPPIARTFVADAEALERLVPLVYATVRPEDDRKNTSRMAQWPRMNAERFRGGLFGHLSSIGTVEAFAALERLANDPRMVAFRDVLLTHARRSPQRSAMALPMTPKEALEWSRHHAVPVRTTDDLYRVVLDRLDDISLDIQSGEFSERARFDAQDEAAFQVHLAGRLDSSRHVHRYEISREVEVDREKMPDIRVSHSACPGHPVSVEIKVFENWTFAELQDALHRQLVGQYLRPHRSRHGILVLCSRPKAKHDAKKPRKKAERKPSRKRIKGKMRSFNEVVQMLRDEALALVASRPDIDALDVVGIDFH